MKRAVVRLAPVRAAFVLLRASLFFVLFALPCRAFADGENASSTGTYAASTLAGSVDLKTGGAQARIPFLLPAPRGVSLSLALSYRSQSGTREAGDDWGFDLPAIERQNLSGPPRYTGDPSIGSRLDAYAVDRFSFGGVPLVPICSVAQGDCPENETMPTWASDNGGWHYFRAEYEGAFLRFFWSPDRETWRVQYPSSGEIEEYGSPLEPTVYAQDSGLERDPAASQNIFRWRLVRRYQRVGGAARNAVVFVWSAPNAQGIRLLSDIYDTPKTGHEGILCDYAHWTHLEWQHHDFPNTSHAPLWRAVPDKRLARVDVLSRTFLNGPLEATRRYHLTYATQHHRSRLVNVQMEGRCDKPVQALVKTAGSLTLCEPPPPSECPRLPKATLSYSEEGTSSGFSEASTSCNLYPHRPDTFQAFDINGDALPDFVEGPIAIPNATWRQWLYVHQKINGQPFLEQNTFNYYDSDGFLASNILTQDRGVSLVGDWFADGLPWVLYAPSGNQSFKYYRPYQRIRDPYSSPLPFPWRWALSSSNKIESILSFEEVGDYDGDGLLDLAHYETANYNRPLPWYPWKAHVYFSTRTPDGAILPFQRDGGSLPPAGRDWTGETIFRTMADANGDSIPDVVLAPKPGTTLPADFQGILVIPGHGNGTFQCVSNRGLPCLTDIPGSPYSYDLPYRLEGGPSFAELGAAVRVHIHDVTGDQLADLVVETHDQVQVWINRDGLHLDPGPTQDHPATSDGGVATSRLVFADTNASGNDDLIVVTPHHIHFWDLFSNTPGLLQSLSNGLGASTSFLYTRVADLDLASQAHPDSAWTTHLPVPLHVVTSISTTNSAPGPASRSRYLSYAYRNPAYDGWTKQFLGFEVVTETVLGDKSAPSTQTTTRYHFSSCQQAKADVCTVRERALDPTRAYTGFPLETLVSDGKGTPLFKTHVEIEPIDVLVGMDERIVRFAHARQTDTWLYDTAKGPAAWTDVAVHDVTLPVDDICGKRPPTKRPLPQPKPATIQIPQGAVHLRTVSLRDALGHVTKSTDFGRIEGGPTDRPIVHTADWIQVDPQGGWQWRIQASRTRAFTYHPGEPVEYDRTSRYEYNAEGRLQDAYGELKGSLPLERHHTDPSQVTAPLPPKASHNGSVRLAHYTYDSTTGLPTQIESPEQGCTRIGYDEAFGALPTKHTVFTDGCDQNPITTLRAYDRGLEVVTMTLTPTGAMSLSEFDPFGRLKSVFAPYPTIGVASSEPSLSVEYVQDFPLLRIHQKTRNDQGDHETWSYVDGFGETLLTLSEADKDKGDKGAWIARGLPIVSPNGHIIEAFDPWFFDGDPERVPLTLDRTRPSQNALYDAFGRVVQTWGYDTLPTSQRVYHALSEDVWDASDLDPQSPHKNTPTTRTYDGHGRLETLTEKGKNGQSTTVSTVTTNFVYQATGELKKLTRTSGNVSFSRSMFFDSFGRRVETLEPNTSLRVGPLSLGFRYAYDDRGLLVGTSDTRGCGKNLFYDGAGRLLAEDFSPCTSSQPAYSPLDLRTGQGSEAFYRYDTTDADLAWSNFGRYTGRLTETFDRGAHTQILLDARGRTKSVLRRIAKPGPASVDLASRYAPHLYRQDQDFDEANRLTRKTTGADVPELLGPDPLHPSDVTFDYSERGIVTSLQSSYGPLLSRAIFGPQGRPEGETYGAPNASLVTSYDYDPQTQRLKNFRLSRGAKDLENLTYDYEASLLKTIRDDRNKDEWAQGAKPVSRTFVYDDFYRLTSITYDSGNDAFASTFAQDRSLRAVLPPRLLPKRVQSQTFDFDALGNLTKTTDDTPDAFFDRSLGELKHASLQPNRLVGDTAGKLSVSYDEAGNLTDLTVTRTACADPQGQCSHRFAYDWDEEGQLARARRWDASGAPPATGDSPAADLRYTYAGGARVVRETRTPGAPPLYSVWIFDSLRLDGAHFEDDYERTAKTESLELAGLGRVLVLPDDAEHGLSGTRRVFLRFPDHLGSTSTVVDHATGELVSKTTYQAFGAVDSEYRATRWGSVHEDVRFTGKEDDVEVGLVYFGARYYAPALGRWLSPDPLTIHALGSDLNPYAYVGGQVTTLTDALGLCGGRPGVCCECGAGGGQVEGPQGPQTVYQSGSGTPSNGQRHPVSDAVNWVWDNTVGAAVDAIGSAIDSIGSLFGGGNHSPAPPQSPNGTFGTSSTSSQIMSGFGRAAHDFGIAAISTPDALAADMPSLAGNCGEVCIPNAVQGQWLQTWGPRFMGPPSGFAGTATYNIVTKITVIASLFSPGRFASVLGAETKGLGAVISETTYVEGSFSISDWSGYPAGMPKPGGPFRVLSGEEYAAARTSANSANRAIRKAHPELVGSDQEIHEIQPVKFGGSPTDSANKILIPSADHVGPQGVHPRFWTPLLRWINGG